MKHVRVEVDPSSMVVDGEEMGVPVAGRGKQQAGGAAGAGKEEEECARLLLEMFGGGGPK